MTRRQVWRYKCDHCGKSNCSASSIARHEKGCFRNPARYCDLCETQWPRPELIAIANEALDIPQEDERSCQEWETYSEAPPHPLLVSTLEKLRSEADVCPCCVMSAIIQSDVRYMFPFDFKKERRKWDEAQGAYEDQVNADRNAYHRPYVGEVF